MIEFCYEQMAAPNLGYPNLAQSFSVPGSQDWNSLDHVWPRTVPLRLLMYLDWANIPYSVVTTPKNFAWYPVGIAWFDHAIDYFELMSTQSLELLRQKRLKVLFYYHEGDNPFVIKDRLDQLVTKHKLHADSYVFISANTMASWCKNFLYVPDHELFFNHANRYQQPIVSNSNRRYMFTAVNRLHKWWRAAAMTDLILNDLLENSLWSYNTANNLGDESYTDSPIVFGWKLDWRNRAEKFINESPYYCDLLTEQQHNTHGQVNLDLYNQSWCHIVLETYFDVDQSGGTFITEKTFKAIKYAQPFVIVGPAGTLAELRRMGYRTFDHAIDNSYDTIQDNSQRWFAIVRALKQIKSHTNMQQWFDLCRDDLVHNQKMFLSRPLDTLNTLIKELE